MPTDAVRSVSEFLQTIRSADRTRLAGVIDVKDVQAARILLESGEALQADAEGTGEDDAVHAAVRDDE